MRSKFSWYFKPDDNEVKEIWDSGILTLDTNVLLDLYRYHENTRNSILQSVQSFKGRLWLTHQTAEEFFRNRAKVIVGSSSGFKQAEEELAKLKKNYTASIDQLKSNRIISEELVEKLNESLGAAISEAEANINAARQMFPNYLDKDPILDQLLGHFEGAVGEAFNDDDLKLAKTEGERRKKNKIPPGYMDDDKDGDRPYGDYYMWRQILDHAKSQKRPMILVTSERKEDWWERPSGKTIGPRQELLKEAHEHAEQRILIYQTDRFLQFSAELLGDQVDQSAVEEIRAVDSMRSGGNGIVKVMSQSTNENSNSSNSGQLTIELKKAVFRFTGSGHFDPALAGVPNLSVSLASHPDSLPNYRIAAGTGTNHDFNIHLKSQDYGIPLPAGIYVFQYSAQCIEMDEDDIFPQESN
ncbi:MAG: PIN domain-containing protein [Pseudomonas sp.]|nr:PIN domain-containing protein [Pseudomonas sp.]